MSFLRTFERASSCNTETAYKIASQSLFAFLCPALYDQAPFRTDRRHGRRRKQELMDGLPSRHEMDNCFVTALVQAGSCHMGQTRKNHTQHTGSTATSTFRARHAPTVSPALQQRGLHTKYTRPIRERNTAPTVSAEDLHNLVDIYSTRQGLAPLEATDLNGNVGIGPEVLELPWNDAYFTHNQYLAHSEPRSETARVLKAMELLLDDHHASHEELYSLYQKLPGNRVNYIPSHTLVRLITHLSQTTASRFKTEYADKFLSLLYDMRAEDMPVNVKLWTTAIRFLALSEGPKQAVRLWREMEQHYDVKANNYTFSILFDSAVKSEHFALAEMIEKESRERNIPLDRISRMSRIFYYGILGDGQNVRTSYAQLVDAGEIVDTAVLTNVITALIDVGELPAAEETFERMKRLHAEKKGATQAPHTWRQRKKLRALLTDAGHRYRTRPEDRQVFQDAAPINPDWRTYRAFVRHHALETAEWYRVEHLLDEMRKSGIGLNKEIFRVLFAGFAKHGGIQLASWNRKNLERTWQDFDRQRTRDPYENELDSGLAITIVKAFCNCADKWRAKVIWETLLDHWEPPNSVEMVVERLLQKQRS